MNKRITLIFSAFCLFACSPEEYNPYTDIDNLSIIAATSDRSLLSTDVTNWIPGEHFQEDADYIVFPQSASTTAKTLCLNSWMSPDPGQIHSLGGISYDRWFSYTILSPEIPFKLDENRFSIKEKDIPGKIKFESGRSDLILLSYEQDVTISVSGVLDESNSGELIKHGTIKLIVKMPDKQKLSITIREIIYR